MTSISEIQSILMTTEQNDGGDTFSKTLQRSQSASTDRSLTSQPRVTELDLLEALGLIDERTERILRLKAAIDGGQYYVSSSDLAERLMESMLAD